MCLLSLKKEEGRRNVLPVLLERTEGIICNKMKLALKTEYLSTGYTSDRFFYVWVSLIFECMHDGHIFEITMRPDQQTMRTYA